MKMIAPVTFDNSSVVVGDSVEMDLSNKAIIKLVLGDDIRRTMINNDEITYSELLLMMQRIYRGKLKPEDELNIKYTDPDGDLVSINDTQDLAFAIQLYRSLRLVIFVNEKPKLMESNQVKQIKDELVCLRNKVNGLLDFIDQVKITEEPNLNKFEVDEAVKESSEDSTPPKKPDPSCGAMFDPLKADGGTLKSELPPIEAPIPKTDPVAAKLSSTDPKPFSYPIATTDPAQIFPPNPYSAGSSIPPVSHDPVNVSQPSPNSSFITTGQSLPTSQQSMSPSHHATHPNVSVPLYRGIPASNQFPSASQPAQLQSQFPPALQSAQFQQFQRPSPAQFPPHHAHMSDSMLPPPPSMLPTPPSMLPTPPSAPIPNVGAPPTMPELDKKSVQMFPNSHSGAHYPTYYRRPITAPAQGFPPISTPYNPGNYIAGAQPVVVNTPVPYNQSAPGAPTSVPAEFGYSKPPSLASPPQSQYYTPQPGKY